MTLVLFMLADIRIEAELRAKDPNYRGLDWWIEQVRAEREARGNAA